MPRTKTSFTPGKSGNPSGKPKGSGKAQVLAMAVSADELKAIIAQLVEQAKQGDTTAARLILDRLIPPLRPVDAPLPAGLTLPPADAGLVARAQAVVDAVAGGVLAVGQATQLLGVLADVARIIEVEDLARRLDALEASE